MGREAELYSSTAIQKQILRSLREFYPIKVDEIVLVAAVQKQIKDASTEQIAGDIRDLRDKGLIEESAIRAPFGKTETYRFKISSAGIEYLQSLEEKTPTAPGVSVKEIESRLIETYDRIKADMEAMRQNLENSQRTLEGDMTKVQSSIADHDQVIRTYFVRVIETFGVFVGIFAVVVVSIISVITALGKVDNTLFLVLILIALPIILVSVIMTLLWGIRELVLKAPPGPRP